MGKRKKKESSEKKINQVIKLSALEKKLLSYERDHMIDDHGYTIVGSREKPPVHR